MIIVLLAIFSVAGSISSRKPAHTTATATTHVCAHTSGSKNEAGMSRHRPSKLWQPSPETTS